MFRKILVAYVLVALLTLVLVLSASATAQETCPSGGGWTKVEAPDSTISGTTIHNLHPPSGYLIDDVCVKAATNLYYKYDWNCESFCGWNIGGDHDISHYSYTVVLAPTDTPEPVCEDEEAYNYGDPLPCVYDVCPNLEGLQEEVPEGYVKPGRRCIPKPEQLPTETPTPEPTPEPTPTPTPPPCQEKNSFYLWYDGWCSIRVFSEYWTGTMDYPNAWSQNGYCECGYYHTDGWTWTYHSNCQEDTTVYEQMEDKEFGCGFKECE